MKECIKVWAVRYKDAKGSQQKYNTIFNNLLKKGIQFPTTYFFFPNKDNKDAKPEPSAQSGQSGPANDQRILAIIDKLRKNFEALEQEFYYNAQDIEEDPDFPDKAATANTNSVQQKAPVAQTQNQQQPQAQVQNQNNQNQVQSQGQKQQVQPVQPPEEEILPLMYNAQELEVDGPDESLYSNEEVSSVRDNRKVDKFAGNESETNNSKAPQVNKQSLVQAPTRSQNEERNSNNFTSSQTNVGGNKQPVPSQTYQVEQQREQIDQRIGSGNEIEDVKIKIDPNSIQEHVQGKNTLQLSKVNSLMDSNTGRNEGSMTFKPGGKDGNYSEDQAKNSLSQFKPPTSTGRSIEQLDEGIVNKKEKSSVLDLWKPKKPSEIQIPEYESPNKTDEEIPNTQQIKEINIKIQKDLIPNEDTKMKTKKKDVIDSKLEILSNIEKSEIRSQLSEADMKKLAEMKHTPTEQRSNITSNLASQTRSPKLEAPANPAKKNQEVIVRKEVPKPEKSILKDTSKSEQSIRYELKQLEKSITREKSPIKKDSLNVQNLKSGYMESYQSIEPSREETISYKQQREYVSPKSSNLGEREGRSKGNVDVQRLKSGNIESYQSLDENRSLMLKHISPKSGPINTDKDSRKQDSFEALQLKSGNIESYQSLEEERERKISMSSKQGYVSPKTGPLIPSKDLMELKQRNDLLAQENKEIKARLKDLELKMRDESEKTKMIQEKIEKREENSFIMGSSMRCNKAFFPHILIFISTISIEKEYGKNRNGI